MHLNSSLRRTAPLFASLLFTVVCVGRVHGQTSVSHLPAGYPGKPFTGSPQTIPGTIQAEAYDLAPGDAQDATVELRGQLHRTEFRPQPDSVGLARFGQGHVSTGGVPEAAEQVYVGWT